MGRVPSAIQGLAANRLARAKFATSAKFAKLWERIVFGFNAEEAKPQKMGANRLAHATSAKFAKFFLRVRATTKKPYRDKQKAA